MNTKKLLVVPLLAFVFAPLLGGCVVEDRYPHGYYHHPYYVHHYYPERRVVVVGSADTNPPADAVNATSTSTY